MRDTLATFIEKRFGSIDVGDGLVREFALGVSWSYIPIDRQGQKQFASDGQVVFWNPIHKGVQFATIDGQRQNTSIPGYRMGLYWRLATFRRKRILAVLLVFRAGLRA